MAVAIYCPHCKRHTAPSPAPVRVEGEYGRDFMVSAVWRKRPGEQWWIGICNGCDQPLLILNAGMRIYPHPLPSPTDTNIPSEIARDLDEAKMCFSVECYRACAVMARRCIQSACIAKGARTGDLINQISELEKTGIITKDVQDWATVVRWVGNDSAHPGKKQVTKDDAEDCLKLAEQFLHIVFVTPAVAKARRAAREK